VKVITNQFSGFHLRDLTQQKYHLNLDEPLVLDDKCIYCNLGDLDVTANWVACDACGKWIHQMCDVSSLETFYRSGSFICRKCKSELRPDIETDSKDDSIHNKCNTLLESLNKISYDDILKMEQETTDQSSPQWFLARKIRLTASNFGKIFKTRNDNIRINLSKVMLQQKPLNIIAVKHGDLYEQEAITKYLHINSSVTYKKAGFLVHREFKFLGGSPDGLINKDGIIEVKCPYSERDTTPTTAMKLSYLDMEGKLKTNSNYFYQVQGLLCFLGNLRQTLSIYLKIIVILRASFSEKSIFPIVCFKIFK